MADEKKRAPAAPMDRWWIVAVIVAFCAAASFVLVFAPHETIDKIVRLVERLPGPAQLAILVGAIASAVAMLRNRKGTGGGGGAALALLGALAIGGLASGCGDLGGAASQHRALNVLADTANPTYDLAIESCDEAELFVIARPGTTFEQDEAEMTAIRAACDRVFGGFDALRVAHRLARAAVDGGGDALIAQALAELQAAWDALRALLPEIEGLVTGGGA